MSGGGLMGLVRFSVQNCIFQMNNEFYVPFPDNIKKTIDLYLYILKDKSYNYKQKHRDYVYKNINKLLENNLTKIINLFKDLTL